MELLRHHTERHIDSSESTLPVERHLLRFPLRLEKPGQPPVKVRIPARPNVDRVISSGLLPPARGCGLALWWIRTTYKLDVLTEPCSCFLLEAEIGGGGGKGGVVQAVSRVGQALLRVGEALLGRVQTEFADEGVVVGHGVWNVSVLFV